MMTLTGLKRLALFSGFNMASSVHLYQLLHYTDLLINFITTTLSQLLMRGTREIDLGKKIPGAQ